MQDIELARLHKAFMTKVLDDLSDNLELNTSKYTRVRYELGYVLIKDKIYYFKDL